MRYVKLLFVLLIVGCSSAKELKGKFVNLEKTDTPKNSAFKIYIKENKSSGKPDKKGSFKIKYPEKGASLTVLAEDGYVVIEKPIPEKTESVIVLINDLKEMIKFLEKGQDFDEQYSMAVKEFKKLPISIDQFPIFPGCENKEIKYYQKCFQKKLNKHVGRTFDAQIANKIGLQGKNKIHVVFEVDKEGNINVISAKAPHPRLKKEGIRVVKKLPKMKPGINRNKFVRVNYSLPITFKVQ